jgi:aspartate/methionine/tyrosine aminotransferase
MATIPSGREMADMAIAAGAIDMAQGVVHLPPPASFQAALDRLFSEPRVHKYASPAGYLPYREALLQVLQQQRSDLVLDNILATNGTTGGLVTALKASCQAGEAVALLEPFYPAHSWAIETLGFRPEYVPYTDNFSLDVRTLEQAVADENVSALLLANPANPTGTVITHAQLNHIVELCEKHDALLIVDEVYRDFMWEGTHVSPLSSASLENAVVLRSFSKNLALAGWRAGYAITSAERATRMKHVHEALYVGAPSPAQFALADLIIDPAGGLKEFVEQLVSLYRENRNDIAAAFRVFGMEPHLKEGAYYMMVTHNRASDMAAMQELLKLGIAVAPGAPFYRPGTKDTGSIRIHFALAQQTVRQVQEILAPA